MAKLFLTAVTLIIRFVISQSDNMLTKIDVTHWAIYGKDDNNPFYKRKYFKYLPLKIPSVD